MLQADMLASNGVLCPLPQLGIRAGHRQRVAKHSEWLAKQPSALQPTQGTAADTRAANVRVWVIPHWPGSTSATALPYNECLWPRSFVEHVMVTFVFIGYAPSPFITSFPIIRLPLSQPAPPPVYPYPHFCPPQLCQSALLASANSPVRNLLVSLFGGHR